MQPSQAGRLKAQKKPPKKKTDSKKETENPPHKTNPPESSETPAPNLPLKRTRSYFFGTPLGTATQGYLSTCFPPENTVVTPTKSFP